MERTMLCVAGWWLLQRRQRGDCPSTTKPKSGLPLTPRTLVASGLASDSGSMPARSQVEFPQSVPSQRICATLQHESSRVEFRNSCIHHRSKPSLIPFIGDPISQGRVECKAFAGADADVM